jgi:hypothetical protein
VAHPLLQHDTCDQGVIPIGCAVNDAISFEQPALEQPLKQDSNNPNEISTSGLDGSNKLINIENLLSNNQNGL